MKTVLTIMILATILFVSVQYAEAEIFPMQGKNADMGIFIAIEGYDSIVQLVTENGTSKHFDFKVKLYKSGGFSIKNSVIAVWGHPISSTQYDLTILTSEDMTKLTASTNENNEVSQSEEAPKIIEPTSSVGADITKYDIPTDGRDAGKETFALAFWANQITNIQLGEKYELNGYIYNIYNSTKIKDAKVTIVLFDKSNGYVIRTNEEISSFSGSINTIFYDLSYPEFYPSHCYDVLVTIKYGNYTTEWTDDFKIIYNGNWIPNTSWLDQDRWNHLPQEYRYEPRPSFSNERCN